jgi:hypothetical protein
MTNRGAFTIHSLYLSLEYGVMTYNTLWLLNISLKVKIFV